MINFFILLFLLIPFYSISKYAPLKLFSQSLNIIEENYPNKPDRNRIIEGAIKGMLFEVDPYAALMTKKEVKRFNKYKFHSGIGIAIAFDKNRRLLVLSVLPESKAFEKGIHLGDQITHIQNKSVEEQSFNEIRHQITNKKNSPIRLTIQRKNSSSPLHFSLPITSMRIPSVLGEKINEDFFYVQIQSFKDNTLKELKNLIKARPCFKKKSFPLCSKKGLILDLRYNHGGDVEEALLISDLFVSSGVLMRIKEKDPLLDKIFHAKKIGTHKPIPIVVIINSYSASSSEILAASLKENHRALVFGSKSFGKGSIQRIFPINKKYSIRMTAAHLQTPDGNDIEHQGVTPHIHIKNYPNIRKLHRFKKKFYQDLRKTNLSFDKNDQWVLKEKEDPFLKKATELIFQLSQ